MNASDLNVFAWLSAAVFYIVGDVATTAVGLAAGAVELHPIGPVGLPTMLLAKAIAVAFAIVAYRMAPVHAWAIPAALGAVGWVVVTWNLAVVIVVV